MHASSLEIAFGERWHAFFHHISHVANQTPTTAQAPWGSPVGGARMSSDSSSSSCAEDEARRKVGFGSTAVVTL